jgi:hypothetical protein
VHVAAGIAVGLVVRDIVWAMAVIVGYEVLEAGLRRVKRHGKGLFEYESWPNIWYDVLFGGVGWLLAQGIPPLPWTVPLPSIL